MAQVDRDYIVLDKHIAKYGIRPVLSGGCSAPSLNTPENRVKMYDNYKDYALSSRPGIPIIYRLHNFIKEI